MTVPTALNTIYTKALQGERLDGGEGLQLLKNAPLLDIGSVAQKVRLLKNPQPSVTFVVDTNLNYTNVCDAYCTFCAFYRTEKDTDKYTYSVDQMITQIGKAVEQGVTTVLIQGGLNSALPMEYYEDLVRRTRKTFPGLTPHFFSAPEINKMAEVTEASVHEVLFRLKKAGQTTLPGGGAEELSDRVKHQFSRLSPKRKVNDWLEVHRQAHLLDYRTTATLMYGHLETDEDIIEHLEHVRSLQDEALAAGKEGFTAFIPWSYKRENTPLANKVKVESGPNKYLRMIALSRIYLDNIQHVQASWFSEGKKTGQIALHFGADDFGGTLFDENVMQEAGFYNRTTKEEVLRMIREAGFNPVQRTTEYEHISYYN